MEQPTLPQCRHTVEVQTRFGDADAFGHINNAVYLQYLDLAKYCYLMHLVDGPFEQQPTAPVIADLHITFVEPAYLTDRLTVHSAITAVGDSSLTLEQYITARRSCAEKTYAEGERSDGLLAATAPTPAPESAERLICTARTVMVNIDRRTGRPVTVAPAIRARIAAAEHHS